ncbi:MAG: hypothetical protein QT05_C0013G0025 [archaeon GW2011_AR13]|nr:MAG: hypothetical protein QT05_C0013G0025 [archaeon GW2011_AR13]HIG94977.1 hypothetical protein [Nanoarchaeota archaeon]HIH62911.1 hypothetical protein [Nanoarchaeota archaeon]HIJ10328.1 hypothetical protein [Nanoarchaeota archaeon]
MKSQKYQTSYEIQKVLDNYSEVLSYVDLTQARVYDINGTIAMIEKESNTSESMILTMIGKNEEIKRHISRLEEGVQITEF